MRPRTGLHWALLGLAAGVAYAVLGLLSSEPIAWWPFAALAPVPLFAIAMVASKAGRRALWRVAAGAWVGSLPLWVITHAWMFKVSPVGFFPGMLLQGSWAGLFVLLAAVAVRGRATPVATAVTLAIVWSFVEIVRGSVLFGGYAWLLTGHAFIDAPLITSSGAVLGAYGVGLLVAISAGGLAVLARSQDQLTRALTVIVVPWPAMWLLGMVTPSLSEPKDARVAIIQTNVPQDNRMAWAIEDQIQLFREFSNMTASARGQADLIVWPETMLPGPAISPQAVDEMRRFGLVYSTKVPGLERLPAWSFAEETAILQQDVGVPMIVGATGVDNLRLSVAADGSVGQDDDGFYNSAHLFIGGQLSAQRYDKLRLTIFGEVLPLVSRWEWLERRLLAIGAGGMSFDLDAGKKPVWFDIPLENGDSLRVATPICFEVAYAGVSRRLARGGGERVDALVNLTNDGWFSSSDAGRAMHLKLARWRALENGVPVIRAANTGISTIIDARGRIASANATYPEGEGQHRIATAGHIFNTRTPAVIVGAVPPATRSATLYARFGHLIPWLVFIVGLGVIARGAAGGRRAA
ncbi:MAG: apolipoprotein N-acyltransferase [Phycisphaerales bacterium JB064]